MQSNERSKINFLLQNETFEMNGLVWSGRWGLAAGGGGLNGVSVVNFTCRIGIAVAVQWQGMADMGYERWCWWY